MKITNTMTTQVVLKEMGTRIKDYRLDMNIKQMDLSKKSGVSIATLRRIEAGYDVSISKIIAVLLALDLSSNIDYLIPEIILNPIDISGLGHVRKRASAYKERMKDLWED